MLTRRFFLDWHETTSDTLVCRLTGASGSRYSCSAAHPNPNPNPNPTPLPPTSPYNLVQILSPSLGLGIGTKARTEQDLMGAHARTLAASSPNPCPTSQETMAVLQWFRLLTMTWLRLVCRRASVKCRSSNLLIWRLSPYTNQVLWVEVGWIQTGWVKSEVGFFSGPRFPL